MDAMIKLLFLAIFASCSLYEPIGASRSPASEPKAFLDAVIMVSAKCSLTMVNMRTGELNVANPGLSTFGCAPLEGAFPQGVCKFIDDKGKVYGTPDVKMAIDGSNAFISTDGSADLIYLNLVTRKFSLRSNVYFEHGSVVGTKTCSGDFGFGKEFDDKKNETTKKK